MAKAKQPAGEPMTFGNVTNVKDYYQLAAQEAALARTLNAWSHSPEYQPLIGLRHACTSDEDMLITLEGA